MKTKHLTPKSFFEVAAKTLSGAMSVDSFAPAHPALAGFRLRQTPFAVSQTAQVLMRSANKMVWKYMR
jgi:hypothetical protein